MPTPRGSLYPTPGQFCCSVLSRARLCDLVGYSTPGSSVLHYLPAVSIESVMLSCLKFIPVESVMLSNHLILCRPLLLLPSIFPSIRVISNELALPNKWPKYWSFSVSVRPSNEYSGLIFFRIDWFDLHAVQGLSRVFSNTTAQKQQFFGAHPSL